MTDHAAATTWVLASGNHGKVAEMRELLAGRGIELVSMAEYGVAAPEETGSAFIDNALHKARAVAKATGHTAIADDSGLCVDALGGAPGVYSARYAGNHGDDRANNDRLLNELADVPYGRRTATFHTSIVVCRGPDDPAPLVAQGVWRGRIAMQPQGAGGFGYDPLFIDAVLGQSAAELDATTKNEHSHRGRACRRLLELLDD